ncbi:MAG: tRNA (N(6)-L-threonylcarbamoyladenosine(37)-C(2))-methylthiotransferase MtaB [Calditrichaeota bacterium]|nr:tRNA (N(6)-L-threonylcarbamoyladenosine(37)-C(2))-methylthiotransferase MtaB [Calditrichota bacterium]
MPTVALHTLGCRLNQAETAIIANSLKKQGFEIVEFGQKADLTIINTCTVTEQADSKCRQAVRQSLRKNPDSFVAVVGCYAQMAVETISQIEGVDLIMGNEHKMRLGEYLSDALEKNGQPLIVHTGKISKQPFVIESTGLYDTHTRANLKIQDGCNFVCSFCIIATARGPARSREFDDLVKEAEELAGMGFKEIVLTGVNIGTYRFEDRNFIDVLKRLERIDGLQRIRISSIEPTTVTAELLDYIADSEKICRHLHIPLQSADDKILESMRRKHTFADFEQIVDYAIKKMPDIGLGTDIMVGYPGEDDEQFVNTKKRVADLPLAYFHVFTYSDRKGTTSFKLKPKVPPQIKKLRTRIMIEMGKRKKIAFYQSFIGKTAPVLFEQEFEGYWEGFTDNYMRVKVASKRDLKNQILTVRLTEIQDDKIKGELA